MEPVSKARVTGHRNKNAVNRNDNNPIVPYGRDYVMCTCDDYRR